MSGELRKAELAVRAQLARLAHLNAVLEGLRVGVIRIPEVVDLISTANQDLLLAISTYNDIADG